MKRGRACRTRARRCNCCCASRRGERYEEIRRFNANKGKTNQAQQREEFIRFPFAILLVSYPLVSYLWPSSFYTCLSMSYQAAIDQLNAMVPELYSAAGAAAAQVFAGRDWRSAGCARKSASAVSFGADCRNQRQRLDGRDAGLDSDSLGSAHRTLHVAAPGRAPTNAFAWADAEIGDEDFARLFFRVHDRGTGAGGRRASCRSFPASLRRLTAHGVSSLCRRERGDGGAGSGDGRAAGRDQHRRSAALDRYRHLARPHGVARFDDRRHRAGEGRHPARGGHVDYPAAASGSEPGAGRGGG